MIDGDTIEINGSSYRLLGINTPEKGEKYYTEAKQFLEQEILNKTVKLIYTQQRKDKYFRDLIYVFLENENINAKIIENGFANIYYPSEKDQYYPQLYSSWKNCLEKNINLCEKSKDICSDCIKIREIDKKQDFVIFENVCSFNCSLKEWTIKDEGRKKYVFDSFILASKENINITASDFKEDYVWTESGDTLFLRDNDGKLVSWKGV